MEAEGGMLDRTVGQARLQADGKLTLYDPLYIHSSQLANIPLVLRDRFGFWFLNARLLTLRLLFRAAIGTERNGGFQFIFLE